VPGSQNPSTGLFPANPAAGGSSPAIVTGWLTSLEQWLTTSSANIVAVLIGLVLIAGAVFGFSQVRETVVSTAKGAAAIAA
jgi:hypothetical protein